MNYYFILDNPTASPTPEITLPPETPYPTFCLFRFSGPLSCPIFELLFPNRDVYRRRRVLTSLSLSADLDRNSSLHWTRLRANVKLDAES